MQINDILNTKIVIDIVKHNSYNSNCLNYNLYRMYSLSDITNRRKIMDGSNYEFICRRLALLQNTGIFYEEDGELISWQENPESNPLYLNKELRQLLYERAVRRRFHFFTGMHTRYVSAVF